MRELRRKIPTRNHVQLCVGVTGIEISSADMAVDVSSVFNVETQV